MSWLWDKWLSRSPLGMSLQIVAEQRVRQTEAENLAALTAENLRLERERGEYRKGLRRNTQKVIREGLVAVLISPGFGTGWYSWNTSVPECLFHPEVVAWVEGGKQGSIKDIAEKLFGGKFKSDGGSSLEIHWLPEGERFRIDDCDGAETLIPFDREEWRQA